MKRVWDWDITFAPKRALKSGWTISQIWRKDNWDVDFNKTIIRKREKNKVLSQISMQAVVSLVVVLPVF